jgi:hypothetical protein
VRVTRPFRASREYQKLAVFVLDKRKKALMPCSEKRARLLLTRGRAVVHRRDPFTIRLRDRVGGGVQPVRVKIDPGSKTTGVAIIIEEDGNVPAALSESAMPTQSMPSTASVSIARTAMVMLVGPRVLPRLKPGVLSAGGTDDIRHPCSVILLL